MKNNIKQAVILAAGERIDFDKPSTFLEIDETRVIDRLIRILKENNIEKIVIITGYKAHYFNELDIKGVELVYSDRFKWTGTMHSLSLAKNYVTDDFLLIEGDLIFEERAIDYLLESTEENCLVLGSESGSGDESLVETRDDKVFKVSKDMHQLGKIDGEFIGLSRLSLDTYLDMLKDFKHNKNPYLHYEYVLMNLKDQHDIGYNKIDNLVWSELDTQQDYDSLKYYIYPKLQRREAEFKEKYIVSLFRDIMGHEYEVISNIERLGGMNNNNYKIVTNLGEFVFRLPGKGSNESVNRESEIYNARLAKEIGIDASTFYFDKESGLKITKYIENAETLNITTAKREDNMELIASALNTLHTSADKFYNDFKPFEEIKEYKQTILQEEKELLNKLEDLDSTVRFLKKEIENLALDHVPSHLDAWSENFVKGTDQIYLIDWEYSANYDKSWDVVSIGLEGEYSKDDEELFYYKYFGRKPLEEEMMKMDLLRILMDIYWSLWALSKVSCGDTDLYEYSLGRYERGITNLTKFKENN